MIFLSTLDNSRDEIMNFVKKKNYFGKLFYTHNRADQEAIRTTGVNTEERGMT